MKDRWVFVIIFSIGRSCSICRYFEYCEWLVVEYNEKVFILLVFFYFFILKVLVFIIKKEIIRWEGWVFFMD